MDVPRMQNSSKQALIDSKRSGFAPISNSFIHGGEIEKKLNERLLGAGGLAAFGLDYQLPFLKNSRFADDMLSNLPKHQTT